MGYSQSPKGFLRKRAAEGGFIDVLLSPGTYPEPGGGKRWFQVEVVRRRIDSKGELLEKDSQTTEVYARPGEAEGFALARCPSRLKVNEGEIRTNVWSVLVP